MPLRLKARTDILPAAQREIWPQLAPARSLSFVLYGGTAVALHLGHRVSVDFDFFTAAPLDKAKLNASLAFLRGATIVQDEANTLEVTATQPSGPVKVSFFGGIGIGRINDPLLTDDGALLVASREDLLATKLKVLLQRIEAKDYLDIAALLAAGVSLERALGGFAKMYGNDPGHALRAMGWFEGGDLSLLGEAERAALRAARDKVAEIPDVTLARGLLAAN
jgi:hypothetical protein